MAEINSLPTKQKNQLKPRNKRSTKIDLTPMVDLGFILITFFVFTTALNEHKAMNLLLPNDGNPVVKDEVCESCALTFILAQNNELYYYEGKEENALYKSSDYSSKGIRQLIIEKRKNLIESRGNDAMVVIVKPTAKASFKNMVDMVDECNICVVKRYYLDEITEVENIKLAKISAPIIIR